MRKIAFTALFSLVLLANISMKPTKNDKYVGFDKNLFVSKYELSNGEYREFLNHIKKNGTTEVIKEFLPDSALWMDKFSYSFNQPYVNLYHWHPAYDNYPLVNASKNAIEKYCIWLGEKYNSDPKREFKKVIFRLPTEKEWLKFSKALPNHKLPWYGNFPYKTDKNNQLCFLANIKVNDYSLNQVDYAEDGSLITCAVGSYEANSLGLFDIIGNVAEYTSDDKIKGGSWDNFIDECLIDKTQNYSVPDPRVGFRLVMEVIEK